MDPRRLTDAQLQQQYAHATGHFPKSLDEAWDRPVAPPAPIKGEFQEFEILAELDAYIRKTYGEHYAKDGVQAFKLIAKRPLRGLHFALGNVTKYSDRFGEKNGFNRADLLKVAHYAILALHCAGKLEKTK